MAAYASSKNRLVLAVIGAVVLLAVVAQPLARRPAVTMRDRMTNPELYAGTESCRNCHAAIVESFQGSPHAQALRPMRQALAAIRHLPGAVSQGGIEYEYLQRDGRLFVRSPSYAAGQPIELEWCFGSGETALTFLSFLRTPAAMTHGLEHRLSWWERPGLMDVTIGHPKEDPPAGLHAMGKLYPLHELRSCFGCHATVLPDDLENLSEANVVAGVQCERCHGPGRAHVDAMRRRSPDTRIDGLSRLTAMDSINRCGDCHRRPDQIDAQLIGSGVEFMARFQPVGLVQSACFRKSQGRQAAMTCVTCHDPHEPRERDAHFYSSICLNCHDPKNAPESVACRVAPTAEDCVACHMPKAHAGTHMIVTDHWIRVLSRREQAPGQDRP